MSIPLVGKPHPGPWVWSKFGNRWCLCGDYGMRPIILSTDHRGMFKLRNPEHDLLVPFDPEDGDARLLAASPKLLGFRDLVVKTFRKTDEASEVTWMPGQVVVHPNTVEALLAAGENIY